VDGLVVDENVDWAFRRGHEVDEGQGLSSLGGLGEAVYLGAVVETVPRIVVHAEACSCEKGVSLVGAGAVSSGVDPVGPVGVKVRVPFVVPCVRRWARDRLGHRIVGKLGLEVQKSGIFFKKATVPGVRWETVPLRRRYQDLEGPPLWRPTRAEPHDVLLSLFFLVAVSTYGGVVGSALRAVEPLLGVVATSEVVNEETLFPLGELHRSFGAHEPGTRKGINALAERAEESKVVPRFGNATYEAASLRAT